MVVVWGHGGGGMVWQCMQIMHMHYSYQNPKLSVPGARYEPVLGVETWSKSSSKFTDIAEIDRETRLKAGHEAAERVHAFGTIDLNRGLGPESTSVS